MELASDSGGSVGGEAGSYPTVAAPGSNSDLQQLMVAGYGHYVDGRGEHISKYKVTTSTENSVYRTDRYTCLALHLMTHMRIIFLLAYI